MDIDETFEEFEEREETQERKAREEKACEESNLRKPLEVARRNLLKEVLLDPSSGTFSMSRLCMGIVVVMFMPVYFVFYAYGIQVPPSIIVSSLASLATVYGLNSAFGAYYGRTRRDGGFGGEYGMGMMDRLSGGERDYTRPSSRIEPGETQGRKTRVGNRVIEEIER